MSTDKIIISNMKIFAYHGVRPEEKEKGQVFIIDIELTTDLRKAGESDNLKDTVNYAEVYDLVTRITRDNKFNLIEKLAQTISEAILDNYATVENVKIRVKKPEAPIEGEFDWVAVEMERSRIEI